MKPGTPCGTLQLDPCYSRMVGRQFYEVFRARGVPGAPRIAAWTWLRMGRAGIPTACGCHYRSLEECFAALRQNRTELGMAPVRINLHGASTRDAAAVVTVAVTEGEVTITSVDTQPVAEQA